MPVLTRDDDVFLLDLGDGENRFTPAWVAEVGTALDEVVAADGPKALVTTATGKTWSQGLDLAWLTEHPDELTGYLASVQALFARVLALPVPCVAAIGGHCFAAGAMLALAHDQRVMRADRGFFCLPEVDIQIPFSPGMSALISAKLTPSVAHETMTTGRRYGGADAAAAGLVDVAVEQDALLPAAVERARALSGTHGPTLSAIKTELYALPLARLAESRGSTSFPGSISG